MFVSDYVGLTGRKLQEHQTVIVRDLVAQARLITECALDACNGIQRGDASFGRPMSTWTEDDDKQAEEAINTATHHVAKSIAALFHGMDATFTVQRDPRGAPIEIKSETHPFVLRVDGGHQ
jgi:hypothetical protein